jgi:hypothetical protein
MRRTESAEPCRLLKTADHDTDVRQASLSVIVASSGVMVAVLVLAVGAVIIVGDRLRVALVGRLIAAKLVTAPRNSADVLSIRHTHCAAA